jgi:four helix bundle protein
MSIVLKELRETEISLKIIFRAKISRDKSQVEKLIIECREIIAIIRKSINTAKANSNK